MMEGYIKLFTEDECAPDARKFFEDDLEKQTGLRLQAFKEKAVRNSPDELYTIYHDLGNYRLSISADFQFYQLWEKEVSRMGKVVHLPLGAIDLDEEIGLPDETEHDRLNEMLEARGLSKHGKPDFDKICSITGHSRDSVRSMLAPGKPIPRWVKLTLHVWDYQKLLH